MTDCKSDLDAMRRLLHLHRWTDIEDWVRAVGELADLSDAEIERVVEPSSRGTGAERPDDRSPTSALDVVPAANRPARGEGIGPLQVRDMPKRVSGRAHHLGICRGQSVAMARTAGGYGRTVASLWRVEGHARAWRVGIDGGTIREFLDETVAVGFFLACLRKIAGLES